jgi:hypothetical protein
MKTKKILQHGVLGLKRIQEDSGMKKNPMLLSGTKFQVRTPLSVVFPV